MFDHALEEVGALFFQSMPGKFPLAMPAPRLDAIGAPVVKLSITSFVASPAQQPQRR